LAYQNATDYDRAKTLVFDVDSDGFSELIQRNRTGAACAIDLTGLVLWFGYLPAVDYYPPHNIIPLQLHDMDGDGVDELSALLGDSIHVFEVTSGHFAMVAHTYPYDISFLNDICGDSQVELVSNRTWELAVWTLNPAPRNTTTNDWRGGYFDYDLGVALVTSASLGIVLVVGSELWIRRREGS
jgi:hypothetical protein